MNNRCKFQWRDADNQAYIAMQSLNANCMVNTKAVDSGCLHVNVEENWSSIVTKLYSIYLISQLQTN